MGSSTKQPLPFNPSILVWARERCGLSQEEAASKVNVLASKVASWEAGESAPTARQARLLAKAYDRPFLEFFADSIPDLPHVTLAPDFRFYSGVRTRHEDSAMRAIQEWAEEQRLNALSLIEDLGEQPPVLSANLKFSIDDNPDVASAIAREAMGFPVEDQIAIPKSRKHELPNILRDKIEQMGILVLKQSGLAKLHARGLCLYADPLPVIVFGGEAPSAQAFTLAHEFGHVLTTTSAISGGPSVDVNDDRSGRHIENWCNRFASSFLMPASVVAEYEPAPSSPQTSYSSSRLSELADAFGVSRHAMLIRLVALDYVVPEHYWQTMRPAFRAEEEDYYSSFARSKYYGKRYVNSRGMLYTGLVMEAWGNGIISSHNAAEYMGIKNLLHLIDVKKDLEGVDA